MKGTLPFFLPRVKGADGAKKKVNGKEPYVHSQLVISLHLIHKAFKTEWQERYRCSNGFPLKASLDFDTSEGVTSGSDTE